MLIAIIRKSCGRPTRTCSPSTGLALCSLLLLSGCNRGEPLYPVHGKVTLQDGSPLAGGTLEFEREGAATGAVANVEADGAYELMTTEEGDGAPQGKYRVRLFPPETAADDPDAPAAARRAAPLVPRRYQEFATSGLTYTVTDGDNEFNIVINKK
jgi:hypothetical protein